MVMLETLKRYLGNGWVEADETWTYVSTDDPTGVFKVNADVTGKYSVGMRIKMTNGGNTIHGIITKMGTYEGDEAGYTYITFLHEIDPADNLALHLMANSAITNNYYSTQKAPFGFPLDITKWRIMITSGADDKQTNPTSGTYYNLGSLAITVPIGVWKVMYMTCFEMKASNSVSLIYGRATLGSTTSNSLDRFENYSVASSGSAGALQHTLPVMRQSTEVLTTKTTYYMNAVANITLGKTGYISFTGLSAGDTVLCAECLLI